MKQEQAHSEDVADFTQYENYPVGQNTNIDDMDKNKPTHPFLRVCVFTDCARKILVEVGERRVTSQ